MLCKRPYMQGVLAYGCGQCLPCRIKRRKVWTHRMMLESAKHAGNSFVTLTYNQDLVPSGSTLNPIDPQKWMKRLRKAIYPQKIRYFLVGEYGDKTHRPHYHAAIFGLDHVLAGGPDGINGVVNNTWGMGHTFVGDLTPQSASYICGYTTKKMTKKNDLWILKKNPWMKDLHPEFARMSNRPGIGHSAMKDVAGSLDQHLQAYLDKHSQMPSMLRWNKSNKPLGRYLTSILRQELGYGRKTTDEEKKLFFEKMRRLYEDERYAAKIENRKPKSLLELNAQKILNMESKFKVHTIRGAL